MFSDSIPIWADKQTEEEGNEKLGYSVSAEVRIWTQTDSRTTLSTIMLYSFYQI